MSQKADKLYSGIEFGLFIFFTWSMDIIYLFSSRFFLQIPVSSPYFKSEELSVGLAFLFWKKILYKKTPATVKNPINWLQILNKLFDTNIKSLN